MRTAILRLLYFTLLYLVSRQTRQVGEAKSFVDAVESFGHLRGGSTACHVASSVCLHPFVVAVAVVCRVALNYGRNERRRLPTRHCFTCRCSVPGSVPPVSSGTYSATYINRQSVYFSDVIRNRIRHLCRSRRGSPAVQSSVFDRNGAKLLLLSRRLHRRLRRPFLRGCFTSLQGGNGTNVCAAPRVNARKTADAVLALNNESVALRHELVCRLSAQDERDSTALRRQAVRASSSRVTSEDKCRR